MQELFFRLAFVLVFNIYTYTKEGEAVEAAKEEVDVKKREKQKKNLQPTNTLGAYLYILYTLGSYTKKIRKSKKEKTYLAL